MFSFASSESSTIVSSAGADYRALNSGPLLVAGQANPRRPKSTDHEHRQLLRLTGFKVYVAVIHVVEGNGAVVVANLAELCCSGRMLVESTYLSCLACFMKVKSGIWIGFEGYDGSRSKPDKQAFTAPPLYCQMYRIYLEAGRYCVRLGPSVSSVQGHQHGCT